MIAQSISSTLILHFSPLATAYLLHEVTAIVAAKANANAAVAEGPMQGSLASLSVRHRILTSPRRTTTPSSSSSACGTISIRARSSLKPHRTKIPLTTMIPLFSRMGGSRKQDIKIHDDSERRERLISAGSEHSIPGNGVSGEEGIPRGAGNGGFFAGLVEPICPHPPRDPDPSLHNKDFAPTMPAGRIFSVWDMACLWVGLVVGVPTYYMAGSLVEMGMAWWQGILTVLAGNLVVLVPMVLSGHAGTKFGVPFPVLARASFGIRGANVPSLLRALVACGWFGIQTWIGGQAIYQLLNTLVHGSFQGSVVPWLGISLPEFGCFMLFWLLQVGIIWNGIESIRELEKYSAPILILLSGALLAWAYVKAGGFGPMLSAPSQFIPGGPKAGQFWPTFFPALTANVGFWATLSLNIPDFTRYSKSQVDQLTGQAIGLPVFMAAFTFVGLAVTSATIVIFGRAISDPIQVLALIDGFFPILLSLVGVILATLTTNIAANIVAPANALVNLNPSVFSFRAGGLLTAVIGVLLAPWRLIQSTQGFIYTWLIGYSALLGPVGGIILVDYFALRNRKLGIDDLFSCDHGGLYWYTNGYNIMALVALVTGILPNVPGFLVSTGVWASCPRVFSIIYDNAWFIGFCIAGLVYRNLSRGQSKNLHTMEA